MLLQSVPSFLPLMKILTIWIPVLPSEDHCVLLLRQTLSHGSLGFEPHTVMKSPNSPPVQHTAPQAEILLLFWQSFITVVKGSFIFQSKHKSSLRTAVDLNYVHVQLAKVFAYDKYLTAYTNVKSPLKKHYLSQRINTTFFLCPSSLFVQSVCITLSF